MKVNRQLKGISKVIRITGEVIIKYIVSSDYGKDTPIRESLTMSLPCNSDCCPLKEFYM